MFVTWRSWSSLPVTTDILAGTLDTGSSVRVPVTTKVSKSGYSTVLASTAHTEVVVAAKTARVVKARRCLVVTFIIFPFNTIQSQVLIAIEVMS